MASKQKRVNEAFAILEPPDLLRKEYLKQQSILSAQPPIIQRFLEVQSSYMAVAFIDRVMHTRFTLPDKVTDPENANVLRVPGPSRIQRIGGLRDVLTRRNARQTIRQRLSELESSPDRAISLAAGLLRFCAAQHIIHTMLPAGRSVEYSVVDGEEIPTVPIVSSEPGSAITATTDAITEEASDNAGRGDLQVPFVPAARRFFLPQWVAFDDEGRLLVNSIEEADAQIASMQKYLDVLFAARSLAPYVVADNEFEKKRYGMLGQLVNQGRALAKYKTQQIIETIKKRAAAQSLNRGLGLRLPYFDDQTLQIEKLDFVVIPNGRIMFVPAFVVRAAQEEQAKVSQDTRLNASTRKYLLHELDMLVKEFTSNAS